MVFRAPYLKIGLMNPHFIAFLAKVDIYLTTRQLFEKKSLFVETFKKVPILKNDESNSLRSFPVLITP